MNNLTLANKYKLSPDLGSYDIYIGRPSVLGNPYSMKTEGDRHVVIKKYREWLWRQIQLKETVYQELIKIAKLVVSGKRVRVVCFCSPKPCHGDVIIKAVEWLINTDPTFNSRLQLTIPSELSDLVSKGFEAHCRDELEASFNEDIIN